MSATYVSDESRQCGTQRRYGTSGEAKRVAKTLMATRGGRALGHYRCAHCGWWHLGHPSPWRARAARESHEQF